MTYQIRIVALLLSLIAVNGARAEAVPSDPFESINRVTYSFNDFLDRNLFRPVAVGYKTVTPNFVNLGISNFFANLSEPLTIVNNLLQGNITDAGSDSLRLLVNSTVGLLGFIDVGSRIGLSKHDEDFGQTLGYWGVGAGPYVVLPFLGPNTLRDTFTKIPDGYVNPLSYTDTGVKYGLNGLQLVNLRAKLLDKEGLISGDRYTFIRNVYLQNRQFKVTNGEADQKSLDNDLNDDLDF